MNREQFLNTWNPPKWSDILIETNEGFKIEESLTDKKLRNIDLIYRLLNSFDPKVADLSKRLKLTLKLIGVEIIIPEQFKHKTHVR